MASLSLSLYLHDILLIMTLKLLSMILSVFLFSFPLALRMYLIDWLVDRSAVLVGDGKDGHWCQGLIAAFGNRWVLFLGLGVMISVCWAGHSNMSIKE